MRHTNLEKFCPENRPMAWDLNDLQTPSSRARHSWGNEGNAGSQIPKISQMNWDLSRGFEQVGTWWWVHPIPFWHLQSIYRSAMMCIWNSFKGIIFSQQFFLPGAVYVFLFLLPILYYTIFDDCIYTCIYEEPKKQSATPRILTTVVHWGKYLRTDLGPIRSTHVHRRSCEAFPDDVLQSGWPSLELFLGINSWRLKSQNWREPVKPIRSWWGPPGAGVLRR